jgi:hypothetical protein
MGTPLGLTKVERELAECARRGRELDLSQRSDIAARTVRAQVIFDLATLPFAKWRVGPFRPKPLRLKGGVVVGGGLVFRGEAMTRPVVLTECRLEESYEGLIRQTA